MGPPPCFVYINGERCELLEDRRFAVNPRFPEGTELLDPAYRPPAVVPLSTDPDDYGVTVRKLLPNAHYFARTIDKATQQSIPVNVPQRFIVCHNVPPQTTAEALGRFFESFSQVVEADVLRFPGQTACKGRGYVALASAEATAQLLREKAVFFQPMGVFLYLEPSDRNPSHPAAHLLGGPTGTMHLANSGGKGNSAAGHSGQGNQQGHTLGNHGRENGHHRDPHQHHESMASNGAAQGDGTGGRGTGAPGALGGGAASAAAATNGGPGAAGAAGAAAGGGRYGDRHGPLGAYEHRRGPTNPNSELASLYYFVDHLREDALQESLARGVFWPTKPNAKEYGAALSKGRVFIIFLLIPLNAPTPRGPEPLLYGYARLLSLSTHGDEATIAWVTTRVFIGERQVCDRLGVNVVNMSDGTPLKPELGQSITDVIDAAPRLAAMPTPAGRGGLTVPAPRGAQQQQLPPQAQPPSQPVQQQQQQHQQAHPHHNQHHHQHHGDRQFHNQHHNQHHHGSANAHHQAHHNNHNPAQHQHQQQHQFQGPGGPHHQQHANHHHHNHHHSNQHHHTNNTHNQPPQSTTNTPPLPNATAAQPPPTQAASAAASQQNTPPPPAATTTTAPAATPTPVPVPRGSIGPGSTHPLPLPRHLQLAQQAALQQQQQQQAASQQTSPVPENAAPPSTQPPQKSPTTVAPTVPPPTTTENAAPVLSSVPAMRGGRGRRGGGGRGAHAHGAANFPPLPAA